MPVTGTTGTDRLNYKQAEAISVLEMFRPAAATAASGAATLNQGSGRVTSEALTTGTGATYTLTLTNSVIDSAGAALVFAAVHLGTATQGTPQVVNITPGNGQVVIIVKNIDGTNALNGTIVIDFMVVRAATAPL